VPATDELQADRLSDVMNEVRQAIDEFRYRWLNVRIGGPDATLRGQWAVLSLSLLVVFACFFAIGRLRGGASGSSLGAAPAASAGPSGRAAIPTGLSGGSPIAGAVPEAIAVKPRLRPAVQPTSSANLPAATPAQSFTAETASSETTSQSPSSQSPTSSVATPPSTPEPAAAQPTPAQRTGPSPSPRQGSPKGGSQSSSGPSFDNSG
jgi:hypothetical protein